MNDLMQKRLDKIIAECEKHVLRMNSAYSKLEYLLPITNGSYVRLTEDEIEHIDQYLFRFAKLQDAIGQNGFLAVDSP